MSKAGLTRPKLGRGLSRGAIAASIVVHVVLLTLLAWTTPALRLPTADWRPDVFVSLAPTILRSPPRPSAEPAPAQSAAAPAASAARPPPRPMEPAKRPAAPPVLAAPLRPSPSAAPQPAAPATASSSATGAAAARPAAEAAASGGDPRGAVREAIGCAHEDFLRLNAAERAACERKLAELPKARGATVDPIPPLKRGAYDRQAAQDARRRDHEGVMPNPIGRCEGLGSNFGLGCVPPEAMHSTRFGPTPRAPAPDGS